MTLWISIELLTDTAFTGHGGTVTGARPLKVIPGAALLGAAVSAQGGYHADSAWERFHAGDLRFGFGLPAKNGQRGMPTPRALHAAKDAKWEQAGEFEQKSLFNLVRGRPPRQAEQEREPQLEQQREGFLVPSGPGWLVYSPPTRASMRTAVTPDGRAREGLLYSIEAMAAGSLFLAPISGEDSMVRRIVSQLVGERHLGRSRGSELGKVRIAEGNSPAVGARPSGTQVTLLCMSDLALRDLETGMPTFSPTARMFGLPRRFDLDLTRSFVRTRRFSPYNTFRARPDLERQVIEPGSVLVFHSSVALTAAEVKEAAAHMLAGVGDYTHEGLGEVLCEPACLSGTAITLLQAIRSKQEDSLDGPPIGPLGSWVERQVGARAADGEAWEQARKLEAAFVQAARDVTNAQWGELRAFARRFPPGPAQNPAVRAELEVLVVTEAKRRPNEGWGHVPWATPTGGSPLDPLGVSLVRALPSDGAGCSLARTLELFASRMPRARADKESP